MLDPETPQEVRDEIDSSLEFLKRQIGALRLPKAPPESVSQRLDKIRKQVELLRERAV